MCKERNQYDFMIETIKNDTLRKRVELGLKYYISQANTNKKWWEVTSVLSIMLPAFGSFLSYVATQCSDYECLPSAVMGISFVTTVVNGIITFFKYGERKTSYRNSAETLKNEVMCYACRGERYKNCKYEPEQGEKISQAERLLSEQVESILKNGYNKISVIEKGKSADERC